MHISVGLRTSTEHALLLLFFICSICSWTYTHYLYILSRHSSTNTSPTLKLALFLVPLEPAMRQQETTMGSVRRARWICLYLRSMLVSSAVEPATGDASQAGLATQACMNVAFSDFSCGCRLEQPNIEGLSHGMYYIHQMLRPFR